MANYYHHFRAHTLNPQTRLPPFPACGPKPQSWIQASSPPTPCQHPCTWMWLQKDSHTDSFHFHFISGNFKWALSAAHESYFPPPFFWISYFFSPLTYTSFPQSSFSVNDLAFYFMEKIEARRWKLPQFSHHLIYPESQTSISSSPFPPVQGEFSKLLAKASPLAKAIDPNLALPNQDHHLHSGNDTLSSMLSMSPSLLGSPP